jgi:hypothetical protein
MAASDRRMRVAIELKADDDLHLVRWGLIMGSRLMASSAKSG